MIDKHPQPTGYRRLFDPLVFFALEMDNNHKQQKMICLLWTTKVDHGLKYQSGDQSDSTIKHV